jgi:hypothetical protein
MGMSHSTDDDLLRLLLRILRLRSRISTQLGELEDDGKGHSPSKSDLAADLTDIPAVMKSLRVNFNNEDYLFLPSAIPDSEADPRHSDLSTLKKQLEERENRGEGDCETCKYRECMDELLNILTMCGFVPPRR